MTRGASRPQGYWRVPEYLAGESELVLQRLEGFYSELIRFNRRVNLISRRSELDADISHILDAVYGGRIVLKSSKAQSIFDLGSGNGVPGIVMSILDPKRRFVLVDADERKAEFLKFVTGRLDLKNVTVLRGRVEDLDDDFIECAVSRGFASLSKALLIARKQFKSGGLYFHFKGSGWVREVAEIPSQICTFWVPRLVEEYDLPVLNARMAIIETKRLG